MAKSTFCHRSQLLAILSAIFTASLLISYFRYVFPLFEATESLAEPYAFRSEVMQLSVSGTSTKLRSVQEDYTLLFEITPVLLRISATAYLIFTTVCSLPLINYIIGKLSRKEAATPRTPAGR